LSLFFHNSHPRFIEPQIVPIPTRLLTLDQIDNIVQVVNATSNNGAAHNYLHGKFGKFINLMKAAYLCMRENGNLQSAKDDIYLMMDNLVKSKDISFVSLADVSAKEYFDGHLHLDSSDTVTIATTKTFSGDVQCQEIDEESDISCLTQQIVQERDERNLDNEDTLFIGFAWILKPAFCLFKLCPEVVWVDVTSHSNNKGFHLLTFSSRLLIGKQVVWS
jgi:hypothetical protein